jgi:glycosidase
MKAWSLHSVIFEINTWVWLGELSSKYKRVVDLATIPEEELDSIASHGFHAVWFMGVWERSPAGIEISMQNKGLIEDFRRALPDFTAEDNVGSPYCVRRYVVDEHLGGNKGLQVARKALAKRGIRLILDFVPNHVAPDHPWVSEHPEYFIHGNADDAKNNPASFIEVGSIVFALGRDPYLPAWPDVLQLNVFHLGLRRAMVETISAIAEQCDAIRCDMAMLMLNSIFEGTWGARAGIKPPEDYWMTVIAAIKSNQPEFKFIAEVYWDLERKLLQQGFDFCYDKTLYDQMEHADTENVRLRLQADLSYQQKMVRFIENHDEPRAAVTFPDEKGRAAALVLLTLPGIRLLHEGQIEGLKVRLPVFLARRMSEPVNHNLVLFYRRLLQAINCEVFMNGDWLLCESSGWPDNQTFKNILAWCWKKDDARYIIVTNFSDISSQAIVRVQWHELKDKMWRLYDVLSSESYDRNGSDMLDAGLYIDLEPWKFHFFHIQSQ